MSLADVEEAWREVASAAGASSSMVEKWMTKLATRKSIVRQITTYRRLIEPRLSPEIRVQFLLAVFFKGVETSPGASDAASALPEVEDSLVLLENFFSEAGIDDDILKNSTIEMLNKAKEGESISPNDPVAYLIDSELAALGQPADQYKKYIEEVKEEYPQASPEYYRSTRLKVLQMLLLIPRIYISDVFHDQFETIARENISEEIKSLSC